MRCRRAAIAAFRKADALPLQDVAPPTVAGGAVNAAMEHGVAVPVSSLALLLALAATDAPDANDGGLATTKESNR